MIPLAPKWLHREVFGLDGEAVGFTKEPLTALEDNMGSSAQNGLQSRNKTSNSIKP